MSNLLYISWDVFTLKSESLLIVFIKAYCK